MEFRGESPNDRRMEEKEKANSEAAAHLAMNAASEEARDYLREQARLAHLQSEQIEEENATRRRILKLEHASAAMKVAFELAVALIFTLVAVGLGAAVWGAAADNGLVVQSFSVPPDLVGRGLTGDVVAAKLLDKLSALQSATASNRAPSSYANNWGSDIKLQIPDTGISIGEFLRSLHAWLGHQTRITGEIWRTPTGLAVTARAGNDTGPTFTGTDADLDKLIRQAAESVYRATQPYRYAVYLANAGRDREARAAYENLIANGSPTDRAWALIGLENSYSNNADYALAVATLRRALAIRPNFIMAYTNTNGIESQYEHDEAAHRAMLKVVELAHGPRDPDMGQTAWDMGALTAEASVAADLGDFKGQLDDDRKLETYPEFSGQVDNARRSDVSAYAQLHDGAGTRAAYDDLPMGSGPLTSVRREGTRAFAEMLLGNGAPMIAMRDRFDAFLVQLGPFGVIAQKRQFWPFVALALARAGRMKEAHALIDRTPADCVQCLANRGRIDALEHNWKGADYWFARATHDAPSLPLNFSLWGQALLEKGDYDGATAKFAQGHQLGPKFADPLEMWGEALAARGEPANALEKFAEADRHAPNWGRLHLKWGEALARSGDGDGAKKQFAIARGLDLSVAERAELGTR
jgi:tetratricopeptide (TPR) repeat protein